MPAARRAADVRSAVMLAGALAEPISVIATWSALGLLAEALSRPAVVRAATAVSRAHAAGNPVATRRALALLQSGGGARGAAIGNEDRRRRS